MGHMAIMDFLTTFCKGLYKKDYSQGSIVLENNHLKYFYLLELFLLDLESWD